MSNATWKFDKRMVAAWYDKGKNGHTVMLSSQELTGINIDALVMGDQMEVSGRPGFRLHLMATSAHHARFGGLLGSKRYTLYLFRDVDCMVASRASRSGFLSINPVHANKFPETST